MAVRKNIGVLIGRAQTYFPREVISGVRRASAEEDVNTFIFLGTQPSDFLREFGGTSEIAPYDYQANSIYVYAHLGGFDGNIINFGTVGYYLKDQMGVDAFTAPYTYKPTLVLTDICSLPGVPSIISNNELGIRQIVDGLIEVGGYTKILFVRGPYNNTDSEERLAGYLNSMKTHGLTVTADMIVAGDFSEFVDDQVSFLLDSHPDAQAIVFSNDEMASSGYRVCAKRGLSVGVDIVITGFDCSEQSADLRPPLTSINQQGNYIGAEAVRRMIQMTEGKQFDAITRVPCDVVWRSSSGSACAKLSAISETPPEDFDQKYTRLKKNHIHFQRHSWTMSLISRQLNEFIEDEQILCGKMLDTLRYFNVDDSYLFLLDKPIYNDGSSMITCPENLLLAASCRQGEITAYEIHERPLVSKDRTIAQIADDGRSHAYFAFLLFSGARQYGILLCDSPSDDCSILYAASLQFGQVLYSMELHQVAMASVRNLTQDMEDILEQNRILDMRSDYDELTGLLNFRGFTQRFKNLNKHGEITAYVAYCDLDHLKEINDTWGHIEGNYAIRSAGHVLKSCLRDGDLLARIGGDEYACLIFSQASHFENDFRQRVRSACLSLNSSSGKPFYVELSIGIHQCLIRPETNLRDIMKLADRSLYEDKKGRRTTIRKESISAVSDSAIASIESTTFSRSVHNMLRRRILIAEDNKINREILKEILKDKYDVLEAENGNVAFSILEKEYQTISLVLLDLVMPECDGYQFLARRKTDPLIAQIPVIVLTGTTRQNNESYCLELGAMDFLVKPYNPDIMLKRINNMIHMKEMATSMSLIETDELTGLYTKQAFYHHARRLLAANPNASFDVIASDIQSFQLINSILGESTGDNVLRCFASFMAEHMKGGICARYNDDRFIALIPSPEENIEKFLSGTLDQFKNIAPIENVSIKSGIYERIDHDLPISRICDRAILALKSIRQNYGRRFCFYDGPVSKRDLERQLYEARFRSALSHNEFILWFQPKYNTYTERIVGAEALVRWNSSSGRMLSPGEFLPIFEEDGLISELDEYVFETVCRFQKDRLDQHLPIIPISVNLSRNSMYRPDLVDHYRNILDQYELSPALIPIEITESTTISSQQLKPIADALFTAGFKLHMDDFGAGSSSLNGLNMMHFEIIKLDKSLIDYIGEKQGDILLKYTMALAKELGLKMVAEGVEKSYQLTFLREYGCDMIQGYYFSPPLPMEDFIKRLSE